MGRRWNPAEFKAPEIVDTPAAAWVLSNPDPDRRTQMVRMTPLRGAYPGRPEQWRPRPLGA
jgi:hypothetical protein